MISAKKVLSFIALFIFNALAVSYIYKNYRNDIMEAIQNTAIRMRSLPYSPLVMVLAVCLCASPPMVGHTFTISMSGYIYGFPGGCLPAALGSFLGGLVTFVLIRKSPFDRLIRKMSISKQEKFDAMSRAVSQGGFKMAFLIRICPLPWQLSSSVLSLCDAVHFRTYCLATFLASFKTSLEVWIGSQLATLTDTTIPPEARKVAMVTMGLGLVILIVVAVWLYRLTMEKIQEMQGCTNTDRDSRMALLLNYEEGETQITSTKISTIV